MLTNQHSLLCLPIIFGCSTGFAQTCNEQILRNTPNDRFEVSGNEARDLKTGLIWQRCNAGQTWDGEGCSGSASIYTWAQALNLSDGQWRLPNIRELASLIESACVDPSINMAIFPDTASDFYWSSSQDVNYSGSLTSKSWGVNFNSGEVNTGSINFLTSYYTDHYVHVRLVKGGY